jgi:hypothetical protein
VGSCSEGEGANRKHRWPRLSSRGGGPVALESSFRLQRVSGTGQACRVEFAATGGMAADSPDLHFPALSDGGGLTVSSSSSDI